MVEQKSDKVERQRRRYTEAEIALIANVFREGEDWLILFRRYILQDLLSEAEIEQIRKYTDNPDVLKILRKTFVLELDKEAPKSQIIDFFSGMDLQATPLDHAVLSIKARKRAWDYISQQFRALNEEVLDPILFDNLVDPDNKTNEQAYIDFVARNFLIGFLETQVIQQLLLLAREDETPEQKLERLKKNSNK